MKVSLFLDLPEVGQQRFFPLGGSKMNSSVRLTDPNGNKNVHQTGYLYFLPKRFMYSY